MVLYPLCVGVGVGGIYRVSRNGMKMLKAEGTVSRYWRRKLATGSKKKKKKYM